MNKKGLTLVELLLVMVIIAIIGVITIPNIIESLNASRGKSGESMEELLVENLKLYNSDNEVDLWDEKYETSSCISFSSLDTIKRSNQDIKLGECRLVNPNPLVIKRVGLHKYKYYVRLVCGKNMPSSDVINSNQYTSNDVYYNESAYYNNSSESNPNCTPVSVG